MVRRSRTYQCPPEHRHDATITCYRTHGCGCERCLVKNRTQMRQERRRAAYGLIVPLEDATPTRDYLNSLSGQMSLRAIARAAGVTQATVQRIRNGTTKRIHPTTIKKLMGITAPALRPSTLVDSTGTIRRLQALAVMGWSLSAVSVRAGLGAQWGATTLRHPTCRAETAARIAAVYDELWATPAPTGTKYQRSQVSKTKQFAARLGWVGPLHWEDIDTDLEPVRITRDRDRAGGWVIGELDHLRAAGESATAAVAALGRNRLSTAALAYRNGRPDLGNWLEAA